MQLPRECGARGGRKMTTKQDLAVSLVRTANLKFARLGNSIRNGQNYETSSISEFQRQLPIGLRIL